METRRCFPLASKRGGGGFNAFEYPRLDDMSTLILKTHRMTFDAALLPNLYMILSTTSHSSLVMAANRVCHFKLVLLGDTAVRIYTLAISAKRILRCLSSVCFDTSTPSPLQS